MEPPSFPAGGPQTVRAAPGSDAHLVVPAPSGTAPFHFQWSRAGAALEGRFASSEEPGAVRLTVSAARTDDTGLYTLQASNAAGSDTARVRLEVSADEAPTGEDPPTFLRRLQDLTVKVGTRTRFLVEILSNTECKVTWYRNERRLLEAERVSLARDGNFWCADVAAVSVDDAGRWTCTAENAGGRASCSAHLNVLVPKAYKRPEFVEELRALLTELGTVSLECKVVGVPTPVLRWFKDSREIKAGDVFALTANADDPTSLGTYTCEAVNCMGRAYSSSKVHVVGRASREGSTRPAASGITGEPPPIFTRELEDQFARICEPLTLSCQVVVPPWPRSVVWYNKEGKVEPSERYHVLEDGVGGYMLEIPSAEWADEGEWKCVATSSGGRVGISTCIVSMDVPKNYRKPRFMENLQAVLTEEGLVSFECKVVGFPTPVLSWFKDGQELKPGDVYQLTGTNSLGSYCCIARNCMGQASSSAELTVEDIQNQLNEEEKLQLFSKNQAPKFVQGLKSVESKIDEPFRFTIKVAIPPEPSVLWYRDDQPVDESARCHLGKEERGVFFLDIENLEFLDQAEWKCVAMNDFGHSVTSCFLKLIIPRHYKKPRFLENLQAILSDEGAVNLECKVIGVPQPVLKWYKDGEELKPGDIHRIISGQDGTCCLGTYTCEASNCMGVAASSASLLGFEDSMKAKEKKKAEEQALQRNLSLSTIHEERTSQMYDTPVGDITLDDKGEISFSFDGKEVSVSLYETPDLTEEEALQIVEMYADQLSENVTEHNVVELPPLRFVKETSTSGNLLMEAIIIDVSPEYFTSPEEDLRTEADVEDISIADENGPPQLSLDQDIDIAGEDYLEKTMALLSEEKADLPLKLIRKKSDSQRSAEDFFSLSREQSLSEEKRDDDTQALSESELHSFASAHSSSKPKSKSSKPSVEDGQESSEPTKTILFKDELRKSVEVEVEPATVKPKRERRTSRGSRRSSSGSEKSISRSKEEPVKVKSEVKTETEAPKKPSMTGEEFRTKMSNVSASLTQVINDVQLIERDIILKSELMSSAATASRSLELISSLITPLSEIHSIADAAKETATESKEVSSTLFNRLPQSLKSLHQSLTIIEKCIDVESDNRTLVKKTCVSFIENCGAEIQKLSSEIKSVTSTDYLTTDDKVLSEIDSLTKEMSTVIKFSADTIKAKNLLSEASEIKVEEPSLQTRHLRDTQKAVFELRTPLNSLLRIVESADSGKIVEISKIKSSDVILNDMSASIQDLQTSLEQIESLSVKESTSPALQKYNTEIIETVVDSILKLRNSFEKLSTDTKVDDKIALKETIKSIKENLNEISTQIGTIERNVGTFDVLQSDNKLDVLQKMAQILITLENNLPRLETMPEVKTHMESFHKNLTKVLENVIESNEAKKYFTLMEICDAVNRINSSIKDIDTENVLPLASLSNTLTIIKDNFVNNVFESELNCSVLTNITDVLVGIQEAINKAEEVSFQVESEHIQDLSPQVFDAMRANMVVEHIDQTIAAINTVRSIETTTEAKSSFAPVLETICPVLEDLRKYIASVGTLGTEHDEHISDISEASFAETIATPLCELNQNLIVLNQSIVENIVSLKESNVIISAVAEPLYELQKTLEIIQQEVISQYGEDLTPYEISVNMASAVQNLQSCILMIQEEAGVEGLDEMSTLEDISGIKTTADTIPSDRLVVPTAEETTTEQNLETFSEEVPKSATAKALHTLNEHIAILQNPEILDALDTLSEVSDYSSLKSVALGLGELHSGIQEILHPIIMEGSSDISNLVNISKLATIAQPLHELQQSLSVLEMNNIPIYENILELPAEKLHSVIEKITDFKEHLDKCAQAIFPAIELADQSIEISNKIGTLRELCEHLKDIIVVTKDGSSDVPASKEVEALEVVVDTLIEATDPMTGITIEKVKSITQELFKKVLEVQEELIQFIPQSPEKLAREAKLIDGMDEVEKSIAVLQEYDFVDLSRVSDITSCTSPQLAMEIDSDSLMQVDDLAANAVNVVQDSNQDMPLADLMIVEDFFKTCKNEFTVLRCLISKASSHKKIVRLLQEFNTLQTTVEEFKTKRFQLSLSDDVNGCLTSFLIQAEECLKNVRNSLVEIVNSQSELLFKEPTAQLNKSVEMLSKLVVEQKDKQLVEVVTKLCNVVLVTKPSMENIQVGVIQELQQPLAIKTREDNQLVKAMEQFMEYIEEQTKISSSIITSNTLKEVLKCIQKYQDFRDATPTGKVLIILKCLSSCADVLRERLLGYKQVEVTEHTAPEGKLRKVLTEMLEPLQVLHSQLVDIQHQVLSGVQEDLISIDIDSTESLVKTMTEKHQDIIQTLESEVTLVANEELSLIMEVDKEIHSIQNAIKSVEDVQATQSMVEIAKPIEIIEKSLQDIISSDKLALESNEKLPKDINSNIDSLECALERFINIEIDLMVASMLLVDIDVNESMQLAVELKSLLTLSPKELASPKVVEMKNETIASLKANLSKFDWLNTDECLKGKPLLQVEKLKRVFLTTYQLLTELNNVNQPAKTKFNEIKQEEKAAELIQHIDQYIELIEIVEEISAIIKIEDLKEAVDIAKELRESISTSEAMKEEETGEITHEISTEQARLALKLQRALMALHVQVLDSAQELAPELSTEVLQRIAKVTAQLQADLVAVTGVHVAVQAPSELIETVKCVQSVEKETLTVQTVPTEAAIEETVATVLEQVEEVKAPEDDKNEAFVSIMEKESVQLQEIVAAEEEQPLVEKIKPESRIMPTAEEAESLASTTTEIVDQTLDRITEISPAEQASIKVIEETAVQYREKILLEDITAIAMETGEEVADVITQEQPAAVDVTERAVVEQIEELKLIDNVEQVTAKEIKEDSTQYQTEQDMKEVVAETITAESSVTAEAAIFAIDEKADELNVGTISTEDVVIAEIVKLVDEQVTASEPKTLDSEEKVDIKSAEEILSVEITESAAIEKAEYIKVEELIMDNQLAKATEQTTSDDQEPITSHDMAIVTSKEVVEQTTTQAEDTEELSFGKATSIAEKVTEISKQIADEQEPEKEAVVVQETLLVEEAKPVSEVLPDSAELKTVEQPAVEIIESLLLEAVSQTEVQEIKIQDVAVRLSEEAIQEIQEIVAVEDITLPEETKPENTDVMPTEQAAAETNVEVVVEDISISKTEDIAKEHAIPRVAEVLSVAVASEAASVLEDITSQAEKAVDEIQESTTMEVADEKVEALVAQHPVPVTEDMKSPIDKLKQHIDEFVCENLVEEIQQLSNTPVIEGLKTTIAAAKELKESIETLQPDVKEVTGEVKEISEAQTKLAQQLQTALSVIYQQALETLKESDDVNRNTYEKIVEVSENLMADLIAVVNIAEVLESVQEKDEVVAIESQVDVFEQQVIEAASMITTQTGTVGDTEAIKEKAIQTAEAKEEIEVKAGENAEALEKHVAVIEESIVVESIDHRIMKSEDEKIDVDNARVIESAVSIESKALESEDLLPEEKGESLQSIAVSEETELVEFKEVSTDKPKSIIQEQAKESSEDALARACVEHSLIEHINELASDEVSEAIENISAVTNKEELKESVVAAKELRECVAGLCANIEEEAGIMPASSKEKAQLAQKLLDSLIVLNTQILDNAQDLTPVIETSTLEKVASIITHLKEDLQTVVVIYEPGVFTADIQKICDIPEENSLKRLELLLQEVNAKINLASPDRNAEDSEVLRDTLDEVQTVIIKLKRDYDEAVNDALNETLEDLECSVRSVQLQINEDSPPELLKEACATLQLLLNNMSETQNMEISETVIKDKKSQTLLEKCSEETQETVKLLDDACKIEAVTHTNLANIVSDLNKLKETIKALRLNFLSDAQTIIDRGIDVTQSLDQVEDRVYSLEKDIDNERQMPSEVRDCIITAIHSVFGSISNMRSTISSIQKRYMFENYGKPSETLLRTIKNVSDIAKLDEEEKIPDWKKFSKSLRKVLNHFEDIKFYINLDKTARLPSDAAFTKIILEDLKLCINEVIITHEIMTKAEESKKVKDTLKCVDKYLGTIESKSALDVKEKIPIFKDIASRIYDVSDAIKKALKIFKVTEIEVELDEMTEPDAKINAAVSEEIKGEESATKVEIDQEKLDLQQAEMLDVEASESSLRHTEDVLVKDAIILIAAEIQNKTEESSDEISKLIATEMSTDTKQTEETVLIPEEDIKSEVVLQTIETVVLHKAEVAQAIADVQISPDIQKDEFVVVYDNEEKLEVMTISSQKEESSDQALQSIVEQKADAQTAKREKIEFKAAKEVEETQERIEVEVVGDSQVQEQVVLDTERSRTQLEGSIDKNRENISQQDKYDTFETETNIVQEKHDDSLLVEEESKQSLVSTEEKKNVTELLRENNVSQKEVAQETAVPADNSIKKKLKIDANLEDISVQQECNTTDDKSDETKIKKKKSPKKKAKSAKTSPGEEETKIEQIESEIVDTGRRSIKERKISDVEEKKEEEQTPTEEKAITVIEEVESPAVQEEKATASLHAGDVDKDDQSYKKEFERLDDEMKVNANKPEKLGQEKVIEQDKSKTETIGKENIVQEEPEKHRLQKEEQNKVTVKSEIKEENLDNEKKEKVSLDKKEPEKESEGTEKLEKERMEREQLETKRLEKEQMETEILEKELLEKEHLDRAEVKKQQIEQERLEKEEQEKLVNEKEEKEKFRQDKKEKIKEEKQEERLEKELTEKEKIEKEQLEKERLEKEQLDKERLEKEQFEKEKIEKDKLEKDRLEKEKIEKEQLEKERLEKEQLANERLEKEKLEKEHLDKERLEKEQLEKEKVQREQLEKDRLEKEKLEKEQLEKKRLEKEHLDKERLEKEQLEKEKVEREQLEKDRLEKEKLEKEQLEKEKLEKEYLDKERLEKEQLEKEKVEREQLEKDRIEKEKLEEEQLEKERLEKEHIDKERLEKEHLDKEILEKEQFEKERLEKEQLENEKLEKEKLDKEQIEKERLEKEHLNKERLEKEKLEKELLEKERLEKEQLDKERLEKEKQEKDQLGKESVEKELIEKERLKKEELDREKIEKEQTEKIRLEKEEQEKLENEKQEKKKLRKEKKENQAKEKLEKEKREKEEEQLEKERLEKEQLEKEVIETEKLGKSQVEKERVEKELLEKEKLQKEQQEKLERERLEKEKLEKEKEKIDRLDKESIKEEQLVKERLEKELLEKEMLEKEEHEKFECEKKENERLRKEKEEKTKREKEEKGRLEQENLVKEKEEKERLEKERSEKEQIDKERLEKEKLEKEKVEKEEREKLESEKKEKEKLRKEKREKIKREREENERLEQEKLDKEKDRLEKERLEKEQLDNERLEKERLEREKLEKEEHEKLESEKKEKEKLRKEKKEKIKREREENERLEQEKLDKEKEEKDRLEKERLEKEQLDNERLEKERLQREKFEKEEHEKLESEKKEKERLRKEKKEKIKREREEKERLEQEKLDKEKEEKDRFEKERLEKEQLDNERLEKEKIEREKLEKEDYEKLENEKKEKEKLRKEKKEKIKREKEEKERLEQENLDKEKGRLEKERLEKEQLDKLRLEKGQIEKEKLEKEEKEKLESEKEEERLKREKDEKIKREKEENERFEKEYLESEKEKLEMEKLEKEQLLKEKTEKERLEKELIKDKLETEEQDKLESEKKEKERLRKEKREKVKREKQEKEKNEIESLEKEHQEKDKFEKEKLEKEKLETEKKEKEGLRKDKIDFIVAEENKTPEKKKIIKKKSRDSDESKTIKTTAQRDIILSEDDTAKEDKQLKIQHEVEEKAQTSKSKEFQTSSEEIVQKGTRKFDELQSSIRTAENGHISIDRRERQEDVFTGESSRRHDAREIPKFVDHNHRNYTMEFARPSGYRERTCDDRPESSEYLSTTKNATIYKAETIYLESQLRAPAPQYSDLRSSEPSERREQRQRSKALSEARSVVSDRRAGSRDLKRKPVFSTYLTDRTAVEGSRVKLTCSALSSTELTITWYKNGVLLDNKLKYRTKFVDGLITLEVLNAVPSDSAEYSCTVENENGSISTSAILKVYPSFEASPIPPTFTRSIRDTYHLAEDELVLECRIRGQPLPTITWLKDERPVSSERHQAYYLADGVCRLAISHPTPEDSGKYTCKAENSMWSDQITHVVSYTGRESRLSPNLATVERSRFNRHALETRRPHFGNVLTDYQVVKGGTIGLQVEIRGCPTRVEWLREGRSVTEIYRNARTFVEHGLYTLALSDVTEKESGLYTCRAWSTHGNVDMNAAITVVQPNELDGKPAIIVGRPEKDILISVGEDINISFRVQGEPKPKVIFMKGIRDITTSQRVCKMTSDDYVKFTVKRSVVSDAGTYCILARNAYGCDRAFVTVVVRQRASSENLISDWTYPLDDTALSISERKYKSVPDRVPGEPSVVDGGNNWLSLAWPKPDPGAVAPVLAYKVESWLIGKEGGARWVELGITPLNSFDAFNLKQGEEYHFRVTPRNRYGWGEPTQTSTPIGVGLAGARPEFVDILPGQLKVLAGETANLSCSVKGKPTPEVIWMKNGHEIEEEGRMATSFNGYDCCLTIKDINNEDDGRYSCEASNLHGRASTYARLAVVTDRLIWEADAKLKRERSQGVEGEYPPQFTMRLRDRRVQATYPVRLTCQVVGNPPPTVTWYKDGEEVATDNRHNKYQDEHFHTLEIAPTNLEDGGMYEALARNPFGAVSCRCGLVVDKGIRAYVAPEFCCGLDPLYRLNEGEELRISAVVEAYPSVGVTWYRDGVRLRPSRRAIMTLDRDGQIELALAAVSPRDGGVYTCTASNEVGRASTSGKVEVVAGEASCETKPPAVVISPDVPYSKEPMFIRKPRSSEAYEGDTVIIQCEVVGDPKPDVYWLRDFLKPDYYRDASHFKRVGEGPEYRFEIPHAKLDYTGAYSVVARNVHGEAKAVISLQIKVKDPCAAEDAHNVRYGRVEVLPRFERNLTDLLSYDGDAVEFECRVSGNPEPYVRWFHYNELIRDCPDFEALYEEGAARLKIKQVTAEDEGTYTCEAANCLGKARSSACLVVYPPGEPNMLSQRLRRPPALLSATSTPRSTPRSTPARSVSRTPGPEPRRLCSPARQMAPAFYTYPFNKVVEEGDSVVFQCAVKGLPAPWATWDKDGIILTPTARITVKEKDEILRILEIDEVTIEDVGIYRITVENEFGRAEASARLEVITRKGKFYGGLRAYSVSPRRSLGYRRRPSTPRQD
ncbi:titin homolog isoform X6 [Manduca sexta]|uniref:titin homolog isoform X6 n=1 Tax=Manduca sexta TaxID=7130 RepID=UPI001890B2AE|nr:titin homolog isoform X6 [Manduca sexta]